MNLVERYQQPTPKFFRILRNIGIALAAIGGTILAAPVALPAALITVGGYLTVAGSVVTTVSQAVVSDKTEILDQEDQKHSKEKSN
ncbi:hypothetical protein [uncultured Polaribacter sp.]|uniref:hypothetical protein n=1 Tax=uncultured Polaribacter sp. TaxID=174711 RepID=UPI002616B24A|nr:hypothetical protein [uncultured Polaribacter sp.]